VKFTPLELFGHTLSQINPLRGLTMARVVQELEAGERGDYAMLQWLYRFIEKRDAVLRGAKRRTLASVKKLEWDVKIPGELKGADLARAEKQKAKLLEDYNRISNLKRSLGELALCEFRGFAHLEKIEGADGNVIELRHVPQWHWCRDGLYGEWQFNADASRGGIKGDPIDRSRFIIREIDDPINEIAVICFTRKGLSQKDFDGFIARFGIPFVFWIMSEQMAAAVANDTAKLAEFQTLMRGIGSDGEGILPGGALETLEGGGGPGPFVEHLDYQDKQIVMAATSGLLTMLTESTGMNSGQADSHSDTFDDLAQALAAEISEVMQDQFDRPVLAKHFPGEEPLCYFELAAKDEQDVATVVNDAKELEAAGWEMDTGELSEKSGYKLTRIAPEIRSQRSGVRGQGQPPVTNRASTPRGASLTDREKSFLKGGADELAGLLADAVAENLNSQNSKFKEGEDE
jgi:phage gp29-like protein